jgi:hypothetical protein
MLRTMSLFVAFVALAAGAAEAAEKCKVKVNKKTGMILVNAASVGANPRWGSRAGEEIQAFANEATCVAAGKASGCALGAPGTAESITPPDLCTLHVADDIASCSAHVPGCTPGVRDLVETEADLDDVQAQIDGITADLATLGVVTPQPVFLDDFEDGVDPAWVQVYGSTQTVAPTGDCGEAYWSQYPNCGTAGLHFDESERWDYQTPAMTPGSFSLYFHDDPSDTSAAAWIGVLSPGMQERLGVFTDLCPNTYYMSLNAGEHRQCTAVPRRLGWHKLEFVRTGRVSKGYLDHVLVFETNLADRDSFDVVTVIQEVPALTLSGFAIDDVRFEAY